MNLFRWLPQCTKLGQLTKCVGKDIDIMLDALKPFPNHIITWCLCSMLSLVFLDCKFELLVRLKNFSFQNCWQLTFNPLPSPVGTHGQFFVEWPNLRYFQHWLDKPKYKMHCTIVASIESLRSSDCNKILRGSFVTFETSNMIMGLARCLMYDSRLSTSSTMPILLARTVISTIFQNWKLISRNCILIICVNNCFAPYDEMLKCMIHL
jgi:hypothetical protein